MEDKVRPHSLPQEWLWSCQGWTVGGLLAGCVAGVAHVISPSKCTVTPPSAVVEEEARAIIYNIQCELNSYVGHIHLGDIKCALSKHQYISNFTTALPHH